MRLSGLKVSIAGTFVGLLGVALVIGNFVTLVFWQKSLMQAEIAKTRTALALLEKLIVARTVAGFEIEPEYLRGLTENLENPDVVLLYFDGQQVLSYPYQSGDKTTVQSIRRSGLTQSEYTSFRGGVMKVLFAGRGSLVVARPVSTGNLKNSALSLIVELDSFYRAIARDLRIVFVYLLVNTLILSVIGLYRMITLVVKPIERMVAVSQNYQITDGLTFSGNDVGSEFGRLSMALNSMLLRIEVDREQLRKTVKSLEAANRELVQTQKEMVLAEKLAAVGRLSAGLAHEIGNPLGIVQGYIELLQQPDIVARDREQFGQRAMMELARIDRLIHQLLDFAKSSPSVYESFYLIPVLRELEAVLAFRKLKISYEVKAEGEDDYLVEGDRDGIKQVLLNCLLNAIDAIEGCGTNHQGRIQISIQRRTVDDNGDKLLIRIMDNGTGVRKEHYSLLFEPFFSTKDPGKGTGLGLSVSHSIIETHGGRIWIEDAEAGGAVVSIEIPRVHHIKKDLR